MLSPENQVLHKALLDSNSRLIIELEAHTELLLAVEDFEEWLCEMIESDDFSDVTSYQGDILFYSKENKDRFDALEENNFHCEYVNFLAAQIITQLLSVFMDKVSSKIKPKE